MLEIYSSKKFLRYEGKPPFSPGCFSTFAFFLWAPTSDIVLRWRNGACSVASASSSTVIVSFSPLRTFANISVLCKSFKNKRTKNLRFIKK